MRCFRRRLFRSFSSFLAAGSIALVAATQGQEPPAAQPPDAQPAAQDPAQEASAAPQEGAAEERPKVVILDEPTTVDPVQFLPPNLTAKATIEFEGASLREVVEWLNSQGVPALLDQTGLEEAALTDDAPLDDSLADEPIYFLLDRLDSLDLDWYVDDGIVRVTSRESAEMRTTTLSHNVGDLYDAGYDTDTLIDLITSTVDPESWPEFGGTGSASIRGLGDVLFVSQNERNHRLILGLLAALRKHGRMTYVGEPPQHELLRAALQEKIVSAEFRGTRLEQAMADLSKQASVPIRLDEQGLEEAAITRRSPVDLTLKQTRLSTTLGAILSDLDLDWILHGGAIVVTSRETADLETKIAVFDVRDLAVDLREADSLVDAITSTLDPESWPEFGGTGNASIRTPLVGVLVVSQNERNLTELAALLARYREAIQKSKQRAPRDAKDPNEVITVYYRLPAAMAEDLAAKLQVLVEPTTWKAPENAEAPGTILQVTSSPDTSAGTDEALSARSTLVIAQTRAVHEKIESTLGRIQAGDWPAHPMPVLGTGGYVPADAETQPAPSGGFGGGGGGFGVGGFGGF